MRINTGQVKFKCREAFIFGWVDPKGIYSSSELKITVKEKIKNYDYRLLEAIACGWCIQLWKEHNAIH